MPGLIAISIIIFQTRTFRLEEKSKCLYKNNFHRNINKFGSRLIFKTQTSSQISKEHTSHQSQAPHKNVTITEQKLHASQITIIQIIL